MKHPIECVAVTKSYAGIPVINNVSLALPKGGVMALLGKSGCGKSTLLKCMGHIIQPDSGYVKVANIASQPHKVGMVFQQGHLWPHMNVLKNMILAPIKVNKVDKKEAIDKALQLLTAFDLQCKAGAFPCQLSGGQQQRVAILRAMMMQPDVLLLDEPTSSLDPESVKIVIKTIKQLVASGTSCMIATHEVMVAKQLATHACFLQAGCVIATGDAQSIWTSTNHQLMKFLDSENIQ